MKKKIWVFLVLIVLSLSAIFAYFYISNKQKSAVQYADVPYQKNEFLIISTLATNRNRLFNMQMFLIKKMNSLWERFVH